MKRVLFLTILSSYLYSTAHANNIINHCKSLGEMAENIMITRQSGTSQKELMQAVRQVAAKDTGEDKTYNEFMLRYIKDMSDQAYAYPIVDKDAKPAAASAFRVKMQEACIDSNKNMFKSK